jgi:hypothetical protein
MKLANCCCSAGETGLPADALLKMAPAAFSVGKSA